MSIEMGSSFTAGLSGSLTRIDIPVVLYNYTAPATDARIRVWNVDGAGLPFGASIASQTIPVASLSALATGGTLSATFATPATVAAGTKYAFTLGFVTSPSSGTQQLGVDAVLAAADKRGVFFTNGTASIDSTYGLSFTTYVDGPAAPPAAPAPSAPGLAKTGFDAQPYLVVAGGLLGLGVIAFRLSSTLRRRKA
jgi:hypothetical protein